VASLTSRLCLLFTPSACRRAPWDTLRWAIEGGVDLVQWRIKGDARPGSERCRDLCRALGVPMIVNDDVDLALALEAAGAHVGQDDVPAAEARARLGPHRLLGVSTHDHEQLAAAAEAGADYVGFGPCYPTPTKGYDRGVGADAVAAAVRATRLPLFAIGGIDPERARALAAAGCTRVAVAAAILGSDDPEAAARALRTAIGEGTSPAPR